MKQNPAVAAVLITYLELERSHGPVFAAAFISEHLDAVWCALGRLNSPNIMKSDAKQRSR